MPYTKTLGTGNKIKFVLLWIVSYIGLSLCSLMPSAQRRWWFQLIRWM